MRRYRVRWPQVQRRMMDLWAPVLRGRLTVEVDWHPKETVGTSRMILRLDGQTIWDFPADYHGTYPNRITGHPGTQAPRGQTIYKGHWDDEHVPVDLISDYLDSPRDLLMEPFKNDHYDLCDILRAADRRLGYQRLMWWSFFGGLDMGSPARQILGARFRNRSVTPPGDAPGETSIACLAAPPAPPPA